MTVLYENTVYDIIRYSQATGKLHIRRTGEPTAPVRRIRSLSRIFGLTDGIRQQFGIPLPFRITPHTIRPWAPRRATAPASFFASDPIVDTEE